MHLRTATIDDLRKIKVLYQRVAGHGPGLARTEEEITDDYVSRFLNNSIRSGLIIVAEHPNDDTLIAEIHAYAPEPSAFRHIFSDLTIAVHPDFQGKKIGRTIFTIFLEEIGLNRPDIGRVELVTRESNERAIRFYQSMGFQVEGRFEMRIRRPDGCFEADIPMSWQNPNFDPALDEPSA